MTVSRFPTVAKAASSCSSCDLRFALTPQRHSRLDPDPVQWMVANGGGTSWLFLVSELRAACSPNVVPVVRIHDALGPQDLYYVEFPRFHCRFTLPVNSKQLWQSATRWHEFGHDEVVSLSRCPVCRREMPYLPHLSDGSYVDYFRCHVCHHVWTINKKDPRWITHVTPLPPRALRRNLRVG